MSGAKIEKIPQKVYDSVAGTPNWKKYLSGTKKHLLFITWSGCPYEKQFRIELNKAFGKKGALSKYYEQNIVASDGSARCKSEDCPVVYLTNHCGGGICIINPQTREIIRDESQNAKQILPLLMAYATWQQEPLLGTK